MKKIMMVATILVAGLMFMPNVFAAYTTGYGTVTDATKSNSKIDGIAADIQSNESTTYVKYTGSAFQLLDEENGRPGDAAWVGITVSYPDGVSQGENYKVYVNGKEHNEGERNEHDYTEYFGITQDNIRKALSKDNHLLEYKVEFDWNNDSNIDQTVMIQIDPMTIELYEDYEKHELVWNEEKAQEELARIEAEKTPVSEQKAEETSKDDSNPDTSDINLYMLLGLIAASGCGIAYTFKKRFN